MKGTIRKGQRRATQRRVTDRGQPGVSSEKGNRGGNSPEGRRSATERKAMGIIGRRAR